MSKATSALVKIVENSASEQHSSEQAQQLIQQGADIKALTRNGPMIHAVIAEEKRLRQLIPWKADNCVRLIKVLEKAAFDRLSAQIFSKNGGDLQEMRSLVNLRATCYQLETHGPLGLLGSILDQDKVPIRIDVLKFLKESDSNTKNALSAINNQGKTCLSLAKTNPNCPKEVVDYIQQQLDEMVNQVPFTQLQVNPNQVIAWIHSGANIEAIDKNGNTVLSNAASANNLELVRALVSVGSDITHKNRDGLTPLEIAKKALPRNPQLIAFLEEQSKNVELKKLIETKKSALTTEEVQALLENGANINASMTNGDSPLHILILNHGTTDMVKAFINDFNADLSATNNKGYRPLEACILFDKEPYPYLQALLPLAKMTTDKFRNPKLNKTLLQFTIEQKCSGATKLIQDELNNRLWNCMAGANTNDDNNKVIIDTVSQLVDSGAQINHLHTDEKYDKWTVLHLVIKVSIVKMLQYLIKYLQADYTLQNGNGDYSISIAAEFGHLLMVEYLHGLPNSNLNVFNKEMETPLHLATKNNHLLVVRYLIKWGADDQAQNRSKQTPLNIARENVTKNKEEEINNNKIIQCLTQLVCPDVGDTAEVSATQNKPIDDFETCDIARPVALKSISMITNDADAAMGSVSKGLFSMSPNATLYEAAKVGDVISAKKAIGTGADIRYCKGNHNSLQVAVISQNEYIMKLKDITLNPFDISRLQAMIAGCQQIVQMIQHIAYTKIVEAIEKSDASIVVTYHQAGALITTDLLYKACSTSDNVEIVDYFFSQNAKIYEFIDCVTSNSIYRIARMKKYNKVAAYLKHRLSLECTKAIKENNLEQVKKLVKAGASVDLDNTNSLNDAIQCQNLELVQFLCENGAKMPPSWLSAKTIVLDPTMSQQLKPEITVVINRHLIERRLRFAAANGDLNALIQCQRLGVNINSTNCHGSTALLCAIQHGNYFKIVHALVSRGASILHFNENVQMSLTDLANEKNYKQIAMYLSQEVNTQFLSAILNNDRQSAEKFAQLGADFNYRDEQQRTPLHYAVQYHGIDLVSWLCECGSAPTSCDVNGDYPIIQAVEKGDYALVELFMKKYPATKKQTNKGGMTALEIAQKLKFNRIVQLIETGKGVPESETDQEDKTHGPNHDEGTLLQAARNGHIKTIREFIAQRYESKEQKKKICQNLIQAAKRASQYEVIAALEPYYKTELRTELASDMHAGSNVVLSERYKKILLGVLGSLNNLIADSSVLLDPADPNTYTQFFTGLTEHVAKTSHELQQVKTEQDVKKLIQTDEFNTQEQLLKIQEKLEELLESKDALQSRVLDTDDRLFDQQKLTAIQRKEFIKEKELHEQQLATYECSIFLFQRQQEAILNRQKAIDFLKSNINLTMFYRTIENRLEALFHSCLAAQGGYVQIKSTTKVPIISLASTITKGILSPVLSKLDEKQQKKEWHNISMMGNIEELRRIASETAGLVTLYYNEQIQSIDTSQKIKGSNIFNDQMHWLKQIYNVRPESSEEMAVVLVAEYVTAWIIDGLKIGTEIISADPVPEQLWLHVAQKDPTNLGKVNKATDILGLSAGQQKIHVKVKNTFGKEILQIVQIRYLIGCVSVIGSDGSVYQYPVSPNSTDNELDDLEKFGYVYATPFSSDQKALESIVEGRKLHLAKRDEQSNILTRFEDIIQHAETFIKPNDQHASKSSITQETANKVAEVLREQKIFVDSNALRDQLIAAEKKIEVTVDVLREQIEEKASYYQVSIDAAHEQLKEESQANREAMKKDNAVRYDQALREFSKHSEEMNEKLQKFIEKRMKDIEEQLQEEAKRILAIAETAKAQSLTAMTQAREACEISRQATENSVKAANSAETLSKLVQQRSEEFKATMQNCEESVKRTAAAQKQFCEQAISDLKIKTERDIEKSREAATKSAADAKESARSARESESSTKDVQKMMKSQVEAQKIEIKKIMTEDKEIRQQSERAAIEAKEAQKQAHAAGETSRQAAENSAKSAAEAKEAQKQAREAGEATRQTAENSAKVTNSAENLSKLAQQNSEEFKVRMKNSEDTIKVTARAQKEFCEHEIANMRTKTERDIEISREAASKSATDAKESARSARESELTVQDVQKMMKSQVEAQKIEIKKIMTEAKELRQQSERAVVEAKEAQKQAARTADTTAATVEKIDAVHLKAQKALEQMGKLTK